MPELQTRVCLWVGGGGGVARGNTRFHIAIHPHPLKHLHGLLGTSKWGGWGGGGVPIQSLA